MRHFFVVVSVSLALSLLPAPKDPSVSNRRLAYITSELGSNGLDNEDMEKQQSPDASEDHGPNVGCLKRFAAAVA